MITRYKRKKIQVNIQETVKRIKGPLYSQYFIYCMLKIVNYEEYLTSIRFLNKHNLYITLSNQMINLIDQRSQINPNLLGFPSASLNLAIFGTQASGKSTLLNYAFQTSFPVLDTLKSRGRCTKGIWFHNINNRNIIDTEGFDSYDRSEEEKIFEKQLSLFCVAVSDIILVNMFMSEIGRYSGGHLDILQSIFKISQKISSGGKKKIVFVIRDCEPDAEKSVLKSQLEKEIQNISKKFELKTIKFSLDFYFMSNFLYEPEAFQKQADKLPSILTMRSQGTLKFYKQEDRLLYIQQLWKKIKSSQTEIDLKSIDDAIKNHIFERLKHQIIDLLEKQLLSYQSLNDVKTYERYIESLVKISNDYLSKNRPRHIKQAQIEIQAHKIFQLFEHSAVKHFNEVILKNIEIQLQSQLVSQIQKNKNSKKMSSTVLKKKKQITQTFKKIITNHKEYSLLLKYFIERIGDIISKQQRKFSHLFSIFEVAAQGQLNKQMDKLVQTMIFKPEAISQRIKSLCQQYQYNEWQINFKEIWEKVTFRCIEKTIPQYIQEKSLTSILDVWALSGDQSTNIIAYHTRMEKRIIDFCRNSLEFLHEQEITTSQPLSRLKQIVRENLANRLNEEQRRFKISLILICIILLLLYGEIETLFGWMLKKKKKRLVLKMYWYGSLLVLIGSLFHQYFAKRQKPSGQQAHQ